MLSILEGPGKEVCKTQIDHTGRSLRLSGCRTSVSDASGDVSGFSPACREAVRLNSVGKVFVYPPLEEPMQHVYGFSMNVGATIHPVPFQKPGAFSLVELLAVLAIVSLLAVLAVGGLHSIVAYRLTSSASEFAATTSLARQTAITSGKSVELRLYKANDGSSNYSAHRIVKTDVANGGTNQVRMRLHRLPDGVSFLSSPAVSTLLADAPETTEAGVSGLSSSNIKVIRFQPDGSIDLPGNPAKWTLTFAANNAAVNANGLPANFVTVSFDVLLGTTEVFRP